MMCISKDKLHLIFIIYAWKWLCYRKNRSPKIDSDSKNAWRSLRMARGVYCCEYVDEYPGTKGYPSTAQ